MGVILSAAPISTYLIVQGAGIDPTGTVDSTTAIQAIITAANTKLQPVYFPPGTFKISSALVVNSGTSIYGAGMFQTTIKQVSTTANAIQGVDVTYLTLRDFTVSGPNSGSGDGIKLTRSSDPNIPYCEFTNIQAVTFGNVGFFADAMIVSGFKNCQARSNGGDGFQLNATAGTNTSVTFTNCYSNANAGIGYEVDNGAYLEWSGCAADNNAGGGYALFNGQSCSLNGCGAEANTGVNLTLSGGIGNAVNGFWVNVNSGVGVSLVSGEVEATVTGAVENSTSGSPTAFLKTVAGTSLVAIMDKHTTANSFAAGTCFEILATGGTAH